MQCTYRKYDIYYVRKCGIDIYFKYFRNPTRLRSITNSQFCNIVIADLNNTHIFQTCTIGSSVAAISVVFPKKECRNASGFVDKGRLAIHSLISLCYATRMYFNVNLYSCCTT